MFNGYETSKYAYTLSLTVQSINRQTDQDSDVPIRKSTDILITDDYE